MMVATKNNPAQSMAAFILSKMNARFPSLHEWELMKTAIVEWMSTEANNLQKWRVKLTQEEDTNSKKKSYKAKIRQQNYLAASKFISRLYQQLLEERQRNNLLSEHLKKMKHEHQNSRVWAHTFQQTMNSLVKENEILTDKYLEVLQRTVQVDQNEYESHIKKKIKSCPVFRKGIEVMIANDINEL